MAPTTQEALLLPPERADLAVRGQRLGYRLASMLINLDRRVRRSHGRGVKLILCDSSGRVLMVRHTYGRRHWTFPGGGVRSHESPSEGALRECAEELRVSPPDLQSLGTHPSRSKRRLDVVSVFSATISPMEVAANGVEISSIGWFPLDDLPEDRDPNVAVSLGLLNGHMAEVAASRHHAT